jgi:uncharacterized membrane protein YfcA
MDWMAAAFMAVAFFVAAFVRGYSGFGFSALVVSSSALVTNPLNFVPVVMFCEFAMTVQLWRSIGTHVDWRRVKLLSIGAALGVPVGLAVITGIGTDLARALIAGYVLLMCTIMLAGWRMKQPAGTRAILGVGITSGLANAPGMGGLPVATFFAAEGVPAAVFRATLIVYFALLDAYSAPLMWWHGMISRDTFVAIALSLPLLAAGGWAGSRHFVRADPSDFRRLAIGLLMALAILGLGKAVLS